MSDYKGIEYLRRKLASKRFRIQKRYEYYEMKHIVDDLKISSPPQLAWMSQVLGWCSLAVNSLSDRLVFGGFSDDVYGLNNIYEMNNRDVLADSVTLGALICSCSFVYLTQDDTGFPLMRNIDAYDATGIIDPITNMLKEGYAVLEKDPDSKNPTIEALLRPHETDIYEHGNYVRTYKHPAPYPLLVPVIYRPDAKRPFGHSRISRDCMSLQDSAARTVKRSEISAEFYSFPQKYVLGMDPSAEPFDKWQATMSAMFRVDKDDDGDKPTVGQFNQQSMAPHLDQIRTFAGLFAGATGLTLDDLGFPGDNPSSYEAIKASHESLRLMARKAQRDFSVGFLNAGYLGACLRDGQEYKRNQLYQTKVRWLPIFEPDISSLAGVGDAVQKIQTSFPNYFTEEKLNELTGI